MNEHYNNRYSKLIEYRRNNHAHEGENHHVIPRCIGGTDDPLNIVRLSYREHYIAHYLLAKIYNDDKLWFAFNMMRRVCDGKSVLYESARKYIIAAISRCNTGRLRSESDRQLMSEQRRGMVVVKDNTGNMFRVNVDDPRYLSGELVFYRTGLKHKRDTIEKMKQNGIKDRVICHDIVSGAWRYIHDNDPMPTGYVLGSGDLFTQIALNRKKTNRWYTNLDTLDYKRFADGDIIPNGYIPGRKGTKRGEDGQFIKTK
jgi:hypothetical protein